MIGQPWHTIDAVEQDVRLVVCDMDGTLLDEEGKIPDKFWDLLDHMHDRGIVFAPASGRQYATLKKMFGHADMITTYIAENGTLVVNEGEVVSTTPIVRDDFLQALDIIRAIDYRDAGVVVGGVKHAYAERKDAPFVDKIHTYNRDLVIVDDLAEVDDEFLKMAVFDFDKVSPRVEQELKALPSTSQIVVSGEYWIDVMSADGNKGKAVTDLQEYLGLTERQTVVFGDYLNDLEMLDRARLSFAMENAHPDIRQRARYLAPSNSSHGVLSVLSMLLDM